MSKSHGDDRKSPQGVLSLERKRIKTHFRLLLISFQSWQVLLSEKLTQTSLIIEIGICKMKIPMKISVIKLYSNSVMSILIDSPHKTSEIQT